MSKKIKLDIKKIKNKKWYKPVSIIIGVCLVILLILLSVWFAKYTVNKSEESVESDILLSGDNYDALNDLQNIGKTTSNKTSTGAMVSIGKSTSSGKTTDNEITETTGIEWGSDTNLGNASELEKMESKITNNIIYPSLR